MPLADLAGAPLLQNTRLFLHMLEAEPARATEKGFLSRSFVANFFPQMDAPAETKELQLFARKVMNELDAAMLHQVRVLCETAKLI